MLKGMGLSMKLALGYGVVLAALAVVGGIGYVKVTAIQTSVMDLASKHMPLSEAITTIDSAAVEQELAATQYAVRSSSPVQINICVTTQAGLPQTSSPSSPISFVSHQALRTLARPLRGSNTFSAWYP